MRTTKKIISAVLVLCMLATTGIVSCFAATTGQESVSGSDIAMDNTYTAAAQAIDDEYTYTKGDLGATYSKVSTTFKVWSPTATVVKVNLYATGSDTENGARDIATCDLSKLMENDKWTGVWTATVNGNLKNVYYTYTITTKNTTGAKEQTKETEDVYSVATGVNGNRSMICDLSSTNPEGWDKDSHVLLDQSTDSNVWELHVKDFSYDKASGVSELNRGKYLAFTEKGTTLNNEGKISTCIDYLKELGITTVQLNPFYDYGSINEAGDDSQFNWGYDPQNYNVPEGSYSSNPYDGNVRIRECKQMIQALHNAGISVVMDVVYNHTFSTNSCFQNTVPNYYYRMTKLGGFSNGSGCGNECATERAMYRDYMIQSLLYWVNEYHVDGFRFDLMGIMDGETMNMARAALDKVDPRITTWGEGWTGGDSYHPTKTCTGTTYFPSLQTNASKLDPRIAIFNDGIRDGIKGNAMGIGNMGYIQGAKTSAKDILYGIRANTVGKNKWKASAPSQCVSYDSCHDNSTLYDQIVASTGLGNYGDRNATAVKMNKLAGAILNTSQGITFTLAGEEMCRTKAGNTNSYKSSPDLNKIDWTDIVRYADVVSYYKGMMKIKSAFSPITSMTNDYQLAYNITNSLTEVTNTISYTITNDKSGEWNKMAVLFNSAKTAQTITLKDTSVTDWVVIANGEQAGLDNLGEVNGSTFTVPAYSAVIAVDKAGFDSAALKSNTGKVKVNYVYEKTGEKLDDSVVLQGSIGTGYVAIPSVSVPNTYEISKIEGEKSGNFAEGTKEVTYYYKNYVPESIQKADFNGDSKVDIADITLMQKYFAKKATLAQEKIDLLDLNYDGQKNVNDTTMFAKYLAGYNVSSGTVITNYYYNDADGNQKKLTASQVLTDRIGTDYSTKEFKVVGYAVDKTKYPTNTTGKISYGEDTEVNYYYTASSLDINLYVKHNGSLKWAPTLWIWGSDLKGQDKGNYTSSGLWPGDTLKDSDSDGWFEKSFTYEGAGTFNVIVSNNGANQTVDYKGFVDNNIWVVIDDSKVSGGTYLTFYTDNPDTNKNAPIAEQVVIE